jgi:hypothetical protein
MIDRVVMDVLDVLDDIPLTGLDALPSGAAQSPALASSAVRHKEQGGTPDQPRLKALLMSRQRVEKWWSPAGKVHIRCR